MAEMNCMYLENLEEYLCDENRIVTYRWLSLTLNVSSNVAKQMLYHYYNNYKNSGKVNFDLSVTYLLTGTEWDDNLKQDVYKVCVVQDKDLEDTKSHFKDVFSLHIYSIQKGQIKDLHLLYGNDFDKIKENTSESSRYSAITCPSASLRVAEREAKPEIDVNIKKEACSTESKVKKEDENKENKINVEITKAKPAGKLAKGSIASMFANQTKKNEAKNLENKSKGLTNNKTSPKESRPKVPPLKGAMANFLTKNPVKPPAKEKPTTSSDGLSAPCHTERTSEKTNSPSKRKLVEKEISHKSPEKGSNKKPKQNSRGKRKSSAANSRSEGKRRRIVTMDSSESSDDADEEEPMDESPLPSPPPVPSRAIESDDEDLLPATPPPSSAAHNGVKEGRGRRKKLVDKTFMDKDGYLVTKKEYELVSESDEENPLPSAREKSSPSKAVSKSPPKRRLKSPSKRNRPSPPKKRQSSPAKMKQSSIMNFFTKK